MILIFSLPGILPWVNPNVILLFVDTGIDLDHPDLNDNILPHGEEDWDYANENDPLDDPLLPDDQNGHGTMTAGLAAAEMNDEGVRGVAPLCRIMPLEVNLSSTPSSYQMRADVIHYAVDRRNDFTRIVINCSWITQGDISAIHSEIQYAVNNNVPIFFASGNGVATICGAVQYPAKYPESIAVGALAPCGRPGWREMH